MEEENSEFSFEESDVSETISSSSDLSSSVSNPPERPLDGFESGALEIALDENTNQKLISEVEKHKKKVTEIKLSDPRGVIYLGHLPYGFFENQMKRFFSQFGVVTRLRLARNKKTGNSKHYAFVEFLDPIVAKIVADTMHGYIMFSRVLVCKVIPPDQVHPEMFTRSNKHFVHPTRRMHKEKVNKERSIDETTKRSLRLLGKEERKRKKLEALGIDYNFPGFKANVPQKSHYISFKDED